jgi:uncharacterized protein YuzE
MQASYDPEADAAYVQIRAPLGLVRTEVADDGTVMDCDDETGEVFGYELLSVREQGLDVFQTVPDGCRDLIAKAMAAASVEGRHARVTDTG